MGLLYLGAEIGKTDGRDDPGFCFPKHRELKDRGQRIQVCPITYQVIFLMWEKIFKF